MVLRAWDRFWFARVSPKSLAAMRIAIGCALLLEFSGIRDVFALQIHLPQLPRHAFGTPEDFWLSSYRFPYPWLSWIPVANFSAYRFLESLQFIACIAFTFGLLPRLSGLITAFVYAYFLSLSQLQYHHSSYAAAMALFIVALSPCADAWALRSDGKKTKRRYEVLPLRLIETLTTAIHGFAALQKISTVWISGAMLRMLHSRGVFQGLGMDLIAWWHLFLPTAIIVLLIWMFVTVGLWHPKYRLAAVTVGTLLHMGIDASMGRGGVYNYLMIALLLCFVFDSTLPLSKEALRRRKALIDI